MLEAQRLSSDRVSGVRMRQSRTRLETHAKWRRHLTESEVVGTFNIKSDKVAADMWSSRFVVDVLRFPLLDCLEDCFLKLHSRA